MPRSARVGSGQWIPLIGTLLFIWALPAPAEAQACYTPAPNSTINITNSTLLCTGTYNLNVTLTASNIELNCNNSLLFGNGSSWRYVIGAIDQLNVTVRNCMVRTAKFGILFQNASKSWILNNTIPKFGVVSTNSEGINVLISDDVWIENNSVTNVGGTGGIVTEALGSPYHPRNMTIRGNNVSYNAFGYGIFLGTGGENYTIEDNLLINNGGGAGIDFEGLLNGPSYVNNSTVTNNTAISASGGAGFWLNGETYNNSIHGNNFSYNKYGIRVTGNTVAGGAGTEKSAYNTISNNTLSNNANGGVFIEDSGGVNNNFCNTSQF